jgi:hypothetical protein
MTRTDVGEGKSVTDRTPPTHRASSSLYDVLQVSPTASQEVIHAAYRTLARGFHPDVNPTGVAAQHMLELNAAYHVLGDNARRASYDLQLARAKRPVVAAVGPPVTSARRGKSRPHSPRRVEDARAMAAASAARAAGGRSRYATLVALIVIFALAMTAVFWLASLMLDEVPDGSLHSSVTISTVQVAAQPLLNHA